ncbi:PAQR family membrane homeostasis protein TrhA [Bradymonas sediminis]|uniref:Uncharacterized protein n=1 Tax=Bradymonas sediminis TaxID=1548548 RepID=A0A2Z4FNG4_9DELT|nr:hemolysin III family protein [Bradymonas sediminis]AWV90254.1 hypothetical protein DN745_13310 [Bradymonas sediminis]TDP75777.1 hemolysin III [Bradymonas sediminis]
MSSSAPKPAKSAPKLASGKKRDQTPREEVANAVTHGVAFVLSIIGLVILVVSAREQTDAIGVASVAIYGSSLVLLYLASTLYHSVTSIPAKATLRVFDHTAIFMLIAGSYTPLTLIAMRGLWGWVLFGVIWSLAIFGIVGKLFAFGRFKRASLYLYVGMGWAGILAIKPLLEVVPGIGLALIGISGLAYTLGVYFYVKEGRRYFHAIWHLFVMTASMLHYFAVLFYVLPSGA